jgi:hypothetical protein
MAETVGLLAYLKIKLNKLVEKHVSSESQPDKSTVEKITVEKSDAKEDFLPGWEKWNLDIPNTMNIRGRSNIVQINGKTYVDGRLVETNSQEEAIAKRRIEEHEMRMNELQRDMDIMRHDMEDRFK